VRRVRHIAGISMIHLGIFMRARFQTTPQVCWRNPPAPRSVADAIKREARDGVVRTSLKPRCMAVQNCVLACRW